MRYQFDDYTLDTDRFELSRNQVPIPSEPQVIELLALLVENRERMVSKDEINDKVWHGRVVSDAALSSRIKIARKLLHDDGRTQRYIRTIHKKGFRFVAPVLAVPESPPEDSPAPPSPAPATAPNDHRWDHDSDTRAKPAIAILPFANQSNNPDQEYFSDGITTDLITHLSKHRWLDVVARNTAFGFKGQSINIQDLGQTLHVNYVVEGSVQRSANRVRVNVNLTDCHTGHTLWTDRYDREMADIFALQDEMTEMIAARLEPEIGYAERNRVIHARPANLQAWDCYHLGVYHFYRFTGPDNEEAQRLLRQSQTLDPLFGEAFAWWAYAVILGMVYWGTSPTQALLDEALRACDQALSLAPHNATFHALRARVLLARREYGSAILENRTAIDMNPTFAAAYCGLGDSLAYEGQYDEALENFRKSITLSPNDPQLWAFFTYGALALIFKGDYQAALDWTERAANIPNCQYWTTAHRAVALAYLEREAEAKKATEALLRLMPEFSCNFARTKLFYLRRPEQIERYMSGLRKAGVPEHAPEPARDR